MSRAVTSGDLPASIQSQITSAMSADPDIAAAKSVSPGLVSEPKQKQKKASAPAPVVDDSRDTVSRQREAEERFDKIAREAISRADTEESDRTGDLYDQPRQKRGAMMREEESEDVQVRDANGKFTNKKTKQIVTEKVEAPETDEPAESVESEDDSPVMSHEKALAILRLDGFKSKALEKLSEEEVVELASHRQKVRSGVDQMASELARLKKGSSQAAETEKPQQIQSQAPTAKQQPATSAETNTDDSGFDYKKVSTRLRELYDEKVVAGLEEPISGVAKWTRDYVAQRERQLEPLFNMVAQLQMNYSRQRLERQYPQLQSDEFFSEVLEKVQKMDRTAYGYDIDAILSDATALVVGTKAKNRTGEAARSARGRAQPTASSRRSTNGDAMSRHDAFGAAAAAFEDGDDDLARDIVRNSR